MRVHYFGDSTLSLEPQIKFVFVIKWKNNNHIQGICSDWVSCQRHMQFLLKEFGYDESTNTIDIFEIDQYKLIQ